MYVHIFVCIFGHGDSKKMRFLQVPRLSASDRIAKAHELINKKPIDLFETRTPTCRSTCDCMSHWDCGKLGENNA